MSVRRYREALTRLARIDEALSATDGLDVVDAAIAVCIGSRDLAEDELRRYAALDVKPTDGDLFYMLRDHCREALGVTV